jgi:hypothetical protein
MPCYYVKGIFCQLLKGSCKACCTSLCKVMGMCEYRCNHEKLNWKGFEMSNELEDMWWQYIVIDMNGGVEVRLVRWTHNHNVDMAVVAPKESGWMRVCGLWNQITIARLPLDGVQIEAMHSLDQLWMELSLRLCLSDNLRATWGHHRVMNHFGKRNFMKPLRKWGGVCFLVCSHQFLKVFPSDSQNSPHVPNVSPH